MYANLSDEELLTAISELAAEIGGANEARDVLYARRRALFAEGRRRTPPIGTKALGAAAGVSDVLVSQVVGPSVEDRLGHDPSIARTVADGLASPVRVRNRARKG